ncbi:hypothetical protein CHUAL_011568 [Chamberlinius hualienensis]
MRDLKMADVLVKDRAYCKIILHSAKYPHCTVNGVLLAEKTKSKDSKTLCLVDCIPLFHLGMGLTPMAEVALMKIELHCKSNNLVMAGYYQANMNYNDASPDFFASKLADKIHEINTEAVLIMVDNRQLPSYANRNDSNDIALCLYQNNDGKWKQKDSSRFNRMIS